MASPLSFVGTEPGASDSSAQFYRARCSTFELPPIRDAVVIGATSPVSVESLEQTMKLAGTERFVSWKIEDEIVGAVIAREALVRKVGEAAFTDFVLQRVKPIMVPREILRVDFDVEIIVEGTV